VFRPILDKLSLLLNLIERSGSFLSSFFGKLARGCAAAGRKMGFKKKLPGHHLFKMTLLI
jgi:hypothetical protein